MRQALVCQRFCEQERWRERQLRIALAGGKSEQDEPDWFGVSYRVPVDPEAPFEERLKQWNERVQRKVDADIAAGRSRRQVSEPSKESHGFWHG